METGTATDVLALLNDPDFAEIRRIASKRPLLWSEFFGMRMPLGMDPELVWDVLTTLRRHDALYFSELHPWKGNFKHQWYTVPHSFAASLAEISVRGCANSPLHMALSQRASRHFVVQPLIEETVAAIRQDGLEIEYETAREILLEERRAATPAEQLAFNIHAILCDLEQYAGQEITPQLIWDLHARLTQGIDGTTLPKGTPEMSYLAEWANPTSENALKSVCSLASGFTIDPDEHPMISALSIICKIWRFSPLPSCNYSMGSLVSRLYLLNNGYPVFQYIPISAAILSWRSATVHPPVVPCTYEAASVDCGMDRDWTPYLDAMVRLIIAEFDKLERAITTMRNRDEALCHLLNEDPTINHRQRAILSRALLVPETKFRISSHRAEHGVVYSTARADLLALADRGLLMLEDEDGAFIFRARPDLKAYLERHCTRERPTAVLGKGRAVAS